MSSDTRGAAARKEQVQSAPRPAQVAGQTSTEIAESVRRSADETDTFKVYAQEWVPVRTFRAADPSAMETAMLWHDKKYGGRLHQEDWRITESPAVVTVWVNVWVVKSEWKHRSDAIDACTEGQRVVGRNSREEHVLRDYGIKKVKKAK